jgi:hypothetical protein
MAEPLDSDQISSSTSVQIALKSMEGSLLWHSVCLVPPTPCRLYLDPIPRTLQNQEGAANTLSLSSVLSPPLGNLVL